MPRALSLVNRNRTLMQPPCTASSAHRCARDRSCLRCWPRPPISVPSPAPASPDPPPFVWRCAAGRLRMGRWAAFSPTLYATSPALTLPCSCTAPPRLYVSHPLSPDAAAHRPTPSLPRALSSPQGFENDELQSALEASIAARACAPAPGAARGYAAALLEQKKTGRGSQGGDPPTHADGGSKADLDS